MLLCKPWNIIDERLAYQLNSNSKHIAKVVKNYFQVKSAKEILSVMENKREALPEYRLCWKFLPSHTFVHILPEQEQSIFLKGKNRWHATCVFLPSVPTYVKWGNSLPFYVSVCLPRIHHVYCKREYFWKNVRVNSIVYVPNLLLDADVYICVLLRNVCFWH